MRYVLFALLVVVFVGSLTCVAGSVQAAAQDGGMLFPSDVPAAQWKEFTVAGFAKPVAGNIYTSDAPPCCGVPLGGLATGCLDIDATGVFGFDSTFFLGFPRAPQCMKPFLGMSIKDGAKSRAWVLTTRELLDGGRFKSCTDMKAEEYVDVPKTEDVGCARRIRYFGHYPVADLEYETDAPVSVGLRAWSPFIPGDVAASNIPGAVFEIHLRNTSGKRQSGSVALNFQGFPSQEGFMDPRCQPSVAESPYRPGAAPFDGIILPDASPVVGRSYPDRELGAKMAIGDPSNDGINEVVVAIKDRATRRGFLISFQRPKQVYGGAITGGTAYDYEIVDILPDEAFTAITVGDSDNDGKAEIIAGSSDGRVFRYSRKTLGFAPENTSALQEYSRLQINPGVTGGSMISEIRVGDINADGKNEVVYTTDFAENANPLPGAYVVTPSGVHPIVTNPRAAFLGCALGDYDKDGKIELAVASSGADPKDNFVNVYNLNADCRVVLYETALTMGASEGPTWLVTGDFDGDGTDDLFANSVKLGMLWTKRSGGKWGSPEVAGTSMLGYSDPSNLGTDGSKTFVSVGGDNAYLVGRDEPSGKESPWKIIRWHVGGPHSMIAQAIGDITGDGQPEVLFWHHTNELAARTFPLDTFARPAIAGSYPRQMLNGSVNGISIQGDKGKSYVIGVIDGKNVRTGGDLNGNPRAWSRLGEGLPAVSPDESGASSAVDFDLKAGESKTVRFVLAWYSPSWRGSGTHKFTQFYTTRFKDAAAVANRLGAGHTSLLRRVLAWQQAVYTSTELPVWLRATLINYLSTYTENSAWAVGSTPPVDWAGPDGLFAVMESVRRVPEFGTIPTDWYGGIPMALFFPDLARNTLRGYSHYMRADGAVPMSWTILCPSSNDMAAQGRYDWQQSLNGVCFVGLVDRLWRCTGDDDVLKEFYAAVKKSIEFSMNLNPGTDPVISMPPGGQGAEWWEGFDWYGMTAHAGGLRISCASIVERMALEMGDTAFAEKCRAWFEQGKRSMETKMWNERTRSYYMFNEPETGKVSELIMANQLDGEWANRATGLEGVFQPERVREALESVKKCCLTPYGSASFARPDGTRLITYGIFPPEMTILGMTYLYSGDKSTGLEVLKSQFDNLVLKQGYTWDPPNMICGEWIISCGDMLIQGEGAGDGKRTFGNDYYQNQIIWAVPAAMQGKDLPAMCKPGGLAHRILEAAKADR